MYEIPTCIKLGEQSYSIRDKGDYRMVLDCFGALNDYTLSVDERVYSCLIMFYEYFTDDIPDYIEDEDVRFQLCMRKISGLDKNVLEQLVKQMYIFFNGGNDSFEDAPKTPRLIDWENDEQLICSAVNKVAGEEIRALPYLHWWTFLGYYMAVGESPLSHIVGIRHKIATNQKLEKYERKFQHENPQYFKMDFRSDEDKEYDELIKELWNKDT